MPNDDPTLRRMNDDDRAYLTGRKTWEPHPQGGYRPTETAKRGEIEQPCPDCNAPLIRQGSMPLIRETVFRCGECRHVFLGPDVALADKPPAKRSADKRTK